MQKVDQMTDCNSFNDPTAGSVPVSPTPNQPVPGQLTAPQPNSGPSQPVAGQPYFEQPNPGQSLPFAEQSNPGQSQPLPEQPTAPQPPVADSESTSKSGPAFGAISAEQDEWILNGQRRTGLASEYMAQQNALKKSKAQRAAKSEDDRPRSRRSQHSQSPGQMPGQMETDYPSSTHNSAFPASPGGSPYQLGGQPNPVMAGSMGSMPGFTAANPNPPGKLPGRGWAISTLVSGIVLSLVVAPLLFFTVFIGKVVGLVSGAQQVKAQNTITVEADFHDFTTVSVLSKNSNGWSCQVKQDGKPIEPVDQEDFDYSEFATGDKEGGQVVFSNTYQIQGQHKLQVDCENLKDCNLKAEQMVVLKNISASVFFTPFIISTIVGVLGLVVTVVGIVWLVKVNRRRNEIKLGYA